MAQQRREARSLTLRLNWEGIDKLPIVFVNQVIAQHDAESSEFIITFGSLAPPTIMGTPDDQRQAAAELEARGIINVLPVFRMGVTPERLLQLIKVLQENYRNYQQGVAMLHGESLDLAEGEGEVS